MKNTKIYIWSEINIFCDTWGGTPERNTPSVLKVL